MHTHNLDVSINKLSKIEGHADLNIKIRNGGVKDVDLRVIENKRFFNQAVKGRPYNAVPQLVSRICGTCSIAHLLACIEAIEKTLKIKPSEQTIVLRKLAMYSLMIRDHALHLYYFTMPDIFGVDSVLDIIDMDAKALSKSSGIPVGVSGKDLVHQSLHIKEAGNNLSKLVAGRAVHAPNMHVGGFSQFPDKEKINPTIEELRSIRAYILELAEIFYKCDWELKRKTNFVAIVTKDFSFLEGHICSTSGVCVEEENYWDHLREAIIPYSQASGFKFEGHSYAVGSLARLNLNKDNLHAKTKKDMKKYLGLFPSENIYHNNLAQAIEIMHSIDHSIEILENTEFKKEEIIKPNTLDGEGVGAIEAPRGTLYYWLGIDNGQVRYANLVIPTAQNLINMREDVRDAAIKILKCEKNNKNCEIKIKKEVEKIIRAYDPCMSCAAHFLRVSWDVA